MGDDSVNMPEVRPGIRHLPRTSRSRLKKSQFPFAIVVWEDAYMTRETSTLEELTHSAVRYYTAGWIIKDDEKGLSVASEWAPDEGHWRAVTFVPRGMVVSVVNK